MFRTSKFWLPRSRSPKPPTHRTPPDLRSRNVSFQVSQQCLVAGIGPRHRRAWFGWCFFSHNRNFLLGIWDTFLGGNNGYPRYHWVFFAYPEIHHMLTWLTFCRDKKWQETRWFMAEVDEYQLEKISTLFNSRPPYIPKSCILFLSILPFPWLFKTKKNGGPRIR